MKSLSTEEKCSRWVTIAGILYGETLPRSHEGTGKGRRNNN